MSTSKEKIRARYQQMTDDQILKIAQYEAADLNPTGLEVLQEEIKRRELNPDLRKGIEAQIEGVTEEEFADLANLVRQSSCPVCGKSEMALQSAVVTEIVSIVISTSRKQNLIIACPTCLQEISNSTFQKTMALGWWGIPWGIIRTIQAVIHHLRSREKKEKLSEQGILQFALENGGFLKTNEDKPEAIVALLEENNAM